MQHTETERRDIDSRPLGIGIAGCGAISEVYLSNLNRLPGVRPVAAADIDLERARACAATHGVPRACSVEDMLADPEVDIVLDLAPPPAHVEISLRALEAGKHVYGEKPLTTLRDDARRVLQQAAQLSLRVGCAPDTFLGSALQLERRLLDGGAIGQVVAASAFVAYGGIPAWHHIPGFYSRPGGGPLYDMGVYFITALVHLLGPVARVSGATRITAPERVIPNGPRAGERIEVTAPTHVVATLELAAGTVVSLTASFDLGHGYLPKLELFGTEGTLECADPNFFDGPVRLFRRETREWEELGRPYDFDPSTNLRGIGVAEMASAMREDRPHRASGELAYHVLDVMQSIEESAASGRRLEIESTCEPPAPSMPEPVPDTR